MKKLPDLQRSKDILRALMDPEQSETVPWSASELAAMLEHQLAAPLMAEVDRLAELNECPRAEVAKLISESKCKTFGDVLREKSPEPELLRMVKDFAKAVMSEPDTLPRDVARILYVASILAGTRVQGGKPLTTLSEASIEREARRCLSFGWLPVAVRKLIRDRLANR